MLVEVPNMIYEELPAVLGGCHVFGLCVWLLGPGEAVPDVVKSIARHASPVEIDIREELGIRVATAIPKILPLAFEVAPRDQKADAK